MRRIRVVVIGTLLIGSAALVSRPSTVSASAAPHFSGNLPGAVTCTLSARLHFASSLTLSNVPTSATVVGHLHSCSSAVPGSQTSPAQIRSGKLLGAFSGSPISCAGPSAGSATGSFTITWKGTVSGLVATQTYSGRAAIGATTLASTGQALVTNPTGQAGLQILGATSGSFLADASIDAYSPDTAAQITAACETKTTTPAGKGHGIKSLSLIGTVTVGAVGEMASDEAGYCAAESSGTVACWGNAGHGALGNNTTTPDAKVPAIAYYISSAVAITSDGSQSYCATLASGAVDCWGYDLDGEIGDGVTGTDALVPTTVGGLPPTSSVASDGGHSYCAQLVSGAVDCWGLGTSGQLGNGAMLSSATPVQVGVPGAFLSGVTAITNGGAGSYCAIIGSSSDAVDCWGLGTSGELGDGSVSSSDTPKSVSGVSAQSIVSDGNHSYCALLTSKAVDCWGANTDGELGDGSALTHSSTPVAVTGISTAVALASDGKNTYCALLSSGAVECWGLGTSGELGDGALTSSNVPVAVSGLSGAAAIAGDATQSFCATLATGALECWGVGLSGELGNGALASSDVPVVATPNPAAPVAALVGGGTNNFCAALFSTGTAPSSKVDCWGLGSGGALGDGSTANQDVPTPVSGFSL